VEAKYKVVRYSGKERDATGLYYYGFRYYAPWLQRWISPDPAGTLQDFNLYKFVANSPTGKIEIDGGVYQGLNDSIEKNMKRDGDTIIWRGLHELHARSPAGATSVRNALSQIDEVFSGAIAAANDSSWDQEPVSRRYFGY
jgi:insecticidal toxin complex protein TccC